MSCRLLLAVALAGAMFSADLAAAKKTRHSGEQVQISGRVTDNSGQPLDGVEVVLEAYHRKLDLLRMKRQDTDLLQVVATTDQEGRYGLEWAWNDHYRVFHLAAALPVRRAGRDQLEIFSRQEITEAMRGSGSVHRDLTVEDAGAIRWLQRFLADQTSEAERRIYQELGRPDRVDPEDSAGETAWWYFAAGKVYRFKAGELDQVIRFEPIPGG